MEYEGGFISGSQFHSPRGSLDSSLGAGTILWTLSEKHLDKYFHKYEVTNWEIKAIKYLGQMQDAGVAEVCMDPFRTGLHFSPEITKSCFPILFIRFISNSEQDKERPSTRCTGINKAYLVSI